LLWGIHMIAAPNCFGATLMLRIRNIFLAICILPLLAGFAAADAFSDALKVELGKLSKKDPQLVEFYIENDLKPIWTGSKNRTRRTGLIAALKSSSSHGLPNGTYKISELENSLKAKSAANAAKAEIVASQTFVMMGRDINSGVVKPTAVDREISIKPAVLSAKSLLQFAQKSSPKKYLDGLAPQSANYDALLKEKVALEKLIGRGGYGQQVPGSKFEPGQSSASIQLLKARLGKLGYRAGTGPAYDATLTKAVQQFQADHGLNPDGVAGKGTLGLVNLQAEDKLARVVANLERERWLPNNRGKRHIFVNIADSRFHVYDNGRSSFTSRTVVGKAAKDFRTPEFSDEMTYMVINPTWHVPASIAGKEYLPILKTDPGYLARQNMRLLNQSGQTVSAGSIDFSKYGETNFPYFIKQKPNPANALGQVKFMFPNRFNVYMHDTPAKSLFNRDYRAYSHGCIRVQKPVEFAHHLLAKQTSNPKGFYQGIRATGAEKYVNLKEPVPVYVSYHTAFRDADGSVTYRGDVYGRDAKIIRALTNAGVRLQARAS